MVTKALILQLCFALDLQLDGMVMEIRGCELRRRGILDVGNLLEELLVVVVELLVGVVQRLGSLSQRRKYTCAVKGFND